MLWRTPATIDSGRNHLTLVEVTGRSNQRLVFSSSWSGLVYFRRTAEALIFKHTQCLLENAHRGFRSRYIDQVFSVTVSPHHCQSSFLLFPHLWIYVTLLESFQWLYPCQLLCYYFISFLQLALWNSHFSDPWLSPRGILTCSLYMISQIASGMQLLEACLVWGNRSYAKLGWTPGPSVSPVLESAYSLHMVLKHRLCTVLHIETIRQLIFS